MGNLHFKFLVYVYGLAQNIPIITERAERVVFNFHRILSFTPPLDFRPTTLCKKIIMSSMNFWHRYCYFYSIASFTETSSCFLKSCGLMLRIHIHIYTYVFTKKTGLVGKFIMDYNAFSWKTNSHFRSDPTIVSGRSWREKETHVHRSVH